MMLTLGPIHQDDKMSSGEVIDQMLLRRKYLIPNLPSVSLYMYVDNMVPLPKLNRLVESHGRIVKVEV